MSFKYASIIFVIFCLLNLSISAPIDVDEEDDEGKEQIQLLDGAFQMHNDELSAFKYELSDGNKREETIKTDDLDNGIAVRGSYTIELADGEMQTIYYISDVNGHRISINKPFSDEEINKPRVKTNWQENEEKERLARGRSISRENKESNVPKKVPATSAVASKDRIAAVDDSKDRFTQAPKVIPTRRSSIRERPRVAVLPDRPKNVEFKDSEEVAEEEKSTDAPEEEEEEE